MRKLLSVLRTVLTSKVLPVLLLLLIFNSIVAVRCRDVDDSAKFSYIRSVLTLTSVLFLLWLPSLFPSSRCSSLHSTLLSVLSCVSELSFCAWGACLLQRALLKRPNELLLAVLFDTWVAGCLGVTFSVIVVSRCCSRPRNEPQIEDAPDEVILAAPDPSFAAE